MPKEEEKEYLKILGVEKYSTDKDEFEIKRAYKRLALQFHPDKDQNDFSARAQFDEVSKAFEFLTLDYRNDSHRQDYDQVFFDFLRDIFDWKQDAEGGSTNNFLTYFCGSKQHPSSSDMDFDSRYQDTEEEEDIDGESELDSIMEIIKNRKKKGKPVPEEFKEENLLDMKTRLNQHKEDMKRDASKKQSSKKGKTPVPVAKPKPKSKKQLQAEQRRREKEMEKIAMELEEKRKEEEEKEKQRKQLEVEKQKRLEEERIKAQNEERKRREKEQKEREKQQKLEQEKEEKRRRQQEEEKKRREEEEKRRKAEKEKADKEKAAKKAAQQAAKEKEEKEKAASKNQNMKRQQQQQRTDQQQYPREIPPRFQRKMKQQQQQQQQQQQAQFQLASQSAPQQQSLPQQPRIQPKPAPPVGKKKDPNRFGPKEFADAIEPVDDSGWSQSAPGKGSGWGNSLETWEDSDKWGSEDRQWGDKEGTWEKLVVDGGDKDTWPTVGSKGAIGDKLKTSSDAGSEKGQYTANSSPKTSVSSMSGALKSDSSAQGNVSSNVDKKSLPSSNWQGAYPAPTENWDVIDESIDQAIDAADAATAKDSAGLAAGWGGVAKGGLGGLIGNSSNWEPKDSSSSVHSQESGKCELANNSSASEAPSWSKTPGKGFKAKLPTTSTVGTSNITTSWGGTPAETNTKWTEPNSSSDGVTNSKSNKPPLLDSTSVVKSVAENKSEPSVTPNSSSKLSASGWGEVPVSNSSNWNNSADITGAACWDSVMSKSDSSELKAASNSKVSQWLESTGMSLADFEWGQENLEHEEGSEGSLDGWTTASKRNRAPKPANDSNAWMNRSLKQLLDMGFKQDDAEKALKANHMNIESAIGDLLAMNISENMEQSVPVPGGKLQEPDPAEAARIQQQQQLQSQSKLNRKQRRKLQQQQQQQQQQAEQNTLPSKPDPNQGQTELVVSQSMTQTSDTLSKPDNEQQSKTSETQYAPKTDETQQDSNSKPNAPTTKNEKPPLSVAGPSKPSNGQAQLTGNGKRAGPPLIPAPGPGVQAPLRPPLAHPLLHPQLVQQFHLQQLRMAQGGLLQPPFTPQQFAMLQQIAQLQLVQQRLAAQSVAQQHMGQKQQVVPQQQLYQQQQQIALMIAQMQQQVLQQQPGLAGRHPALPFTAVQQQQQQSLIQQQQQQQSSPTAQQKGNKPATNEKPTSEPAQNKTTDTVKSQPNEPSNVPPTTTEEQTKQVSPVPQSRLTQWKQPLLQDPSAVTQSSVTSSIPTPVDSNPQIVSTSSQSTSSVLSSVVSAPSISTNEVSDTSAPNSNNVSPRTRIPDPVSSRWGVDAGPKLSADPPEFKPGVPWRPAPRNEKRDDGRDVVSPSTVDVSSRTSSSSSDSQTDSWPNPGNQPVSVPSSVPPVNTGKVADDAVSTTTTNSGFSGLSNNNSTFESSAIDFGRSSTPWQSTESKAPPQLPQGTNKLASSAASLLRPPPGLGSEKSLPESPLFDDEPPAWLKSLIDGSSLAGDKTQPEFQFSRFGFANNPAPWSPRDASPQPFSPLTPNPQPWAAVGGPAPTLSSSGSALSMATSEIVRSGSVSAAEPSNLQNSGIIWSTNQPIPSAEEKLPGTLPGASVHAVSVASGVAPSRNTVNSMSTWLVLRNLSPRMDPKTLRPLCERHGPLLTFQLNLRHGNSLIRYGSMEEAAKARAALNGLMLSGTQVVADFATDSDIGSFFEQTMDWSANPFPSNTYGNQWSFQNVLGSAATSDSIQSAAKVPTAKNQPPVTTAEQHVPKINNPSPGMQWGAAVGALPSQGLAPGEQSKMNPTTQWGSGSQSSEQPGAKPNTGTPGMPWGSSPGATPVPSYLWGSGPSQQPALAGNFSQVPSMWSFPAGVPRDVEPQSGSGDGLVSPSMTTFLPPGLLNGGGDPV